MNKFKVGDRVVVTVDKYRFLALGDVGKVAVVYPSGIEIEGDDKFYSTACFELVIAAHPPPIHKEEIIAWANGEKIEVRQQCSGRWMYASNPSWSEDFSYRVKPEVVVEEVYDMWEAEVERRVAVRMKEILSDDKRKDMLMHNHE